MKSNVKIGLAWAAVTVAGFVRMAAGEPTGCPDFTVEQPRDTKGPVLRAADFGVSTTNADNAAALNRAFEACRKAGASKLVLERGTYKCHGPVGLVLDGLTDFTFDGGDSLLVFWRKNPADWDSRKYHPESAAFFRAGDDCFLIGEHTGTAGGQTTVSVYPYRSEPNEMWTASVPGTVIDAAYASDVLYVLTTDALYAYENRDGSPSLLASRTLMMRCRAVFADEYGRYILITPKGAERSTLSALTEHDHDAAAF